MKFSSYIHPCLSEVLRPFHRQIPAVVLLGLLATALEGIGIGLIIPLLDLVMAGQSSAQGWMPGLLVAMGESVPAESRGLVIGLAILALVVLKNIVAYANGLLQAWIYGSCGHRLRDLLSRRLVHMEASYCLTTPPSRLLNIISNESWRASDAVAAFLSVLVAGAATVIFLLFLFFLSPELTVVVLLGLALIQVAHDLMSRHFARLSRVIAEQNRGLAGRMLHHVTAWRLIRLFHREEFEIQRFRDASDTVRRAALTLQARQIAVGPLTEVAHAALFMVVIFTAWRVGVSFGTAAAFIILLYRLQPQVRQIQGALSSMRGWHGSLDEVAWLLATRPAPTRASGTLPAPPLRQGLRFSDVSFRYATEGRENIALDRVSFELAAGSSLAIIGRSGSGKSTIANLVCGVIDPTQGTITVDGTPLAAIDRVSWLDSIAMASQELELFDGSVVENIRYGVPGASREAVEAAARAADADGFIRELPQGYDTAVGDRGINLSAGQRQRIALARALVREPRLLILDEATNAMDILSEASALKVLEARRGKGATIVISHHLSSIRLCDSFIRIHEGRIVAAGPTSAFDARSLEEVLGQVA
ncbi:ABC transporter ATP-binding protein [Cereibacter sediminicola]|uniref:ABC transporter ATP-binding protein n=1 Tax=Cereibacter sediminicola TaxID=2584941 RepID=UPI00119F143E|nr:ABC transporter ATP-binding protein [Cereibacter sediminicola]